MAGSTKLSTTRRTTNDRPCADFFSSIRAQPNRAQPMALQVNPKGYQAPPPYNNRQHFTDDMGVEQGVWSSSDSSYNHSPTDPILAKQQKRSSGAASRHKRHSSWSSLIRADENNLVGGPATRMGHKPVVVVGLNPNGGGGTSPSSTYSTSGRGSQPPTGGSGGGGVLTAHSANSSILYINDDTCATKVQPHSQPAAYRQTSNGSSGIISDFFSKGSSYFKFANEAAMEPGYPATGAGVGHVSFGSSQSVQGGASGPPAQVHYLQQPPMPAGRYKSSGSTSGATVISGPVPPGARRATPSGSTKPPSRTSQSGAARRPKRDRMQELRDLCARPFARLCCLAVIVLLLAALIVAFVLTQAFIMPSHLQFAWLAPEMLRQGQQVPNQLQMDVAGEQVRFELIGNVPFKSNFISVIDFKTNKVAIVDSSLRINGRNVMCFVMDLDRANIPDMSQLQRAARNSADKKTQTLGWQESWNYLPAPMSNQQAIARLFEPEVQECKGARWVELSHVNTNQKLSRCTECFDFCLPDYGIERDHIRGESFLNILRRACFYLFVPEWRSYAQSYSHQQQQTDFERYYQSMMQQQQQNQFPPGAGRAVATQQQSFGGPPMTPPFGGMGGGGSPMTPPFGGMGGVGSPPNFSGGGGGIGGMVNQVGSVVGSAVQGAVEGARQDPNLQRVGSDLESKWIQLQGVPGQVANATREAFQNLRTNVGQMLPGGNNPGQPPPSPNQPIILGGGGGGPYQPPMDFNQWRQQQQQGQQSPQFPPQQQGQHPQWPTHQQSVSNTNAGLFNPMSTAHGVVPQTPLTASSQYSPLNLAVPSVGVQNPTQQNPQQTFSGGNLGPAFNEQLERLRQQQGSTFPGAGAPPLSVLLASSNVDGSVNDAQRQQQQQWGQQSGQSPFNQAGGSAQLSSIFSGQQGQFTPSGIAGPPQSNSNVGFSGQQPQGGPQAQGGGRGNLRLPSTMMMDSLSTTREEPFVRSSSGWSPGGPQNAFASGAVGRRR